MFSKTGLSRPHNLRVTASVLLYRRPKGRASLAPQGCGRLPPRGGQSLSSLQGGAKYSDPSDRSSVRAGLHGFREIPTLEAWQA